MPLRLRCCLAVLAAALTTLTAGFEFVHGQERCGDAGRLCVPISQCATFQTREQVLRQRPEVCDFLGREAMVCCDAAVPPVTDSPPPVTDGPSPVTTTPSPLPEQCGEPRTATTDPGTAGSRRRRRSELSDRLGVTLDNRMNVLEVAALLQVEIVRPIHNGQDVELVVLKPPALVGGPPETVHRWPWMVVFGRWTEAGLGDWFCGGTLITDRHVLTAAHCLRPEETETVGARIADHDLTVSDEVAHQERNISRIVQHPQYGGSQNDLAVVRLAEPVELTFSVQPICLPPADSEHLGQYVEVAGWGLLESLGTTPDILQEAPLRVIDPADCEAAYRPVPMFERRFPGGFQGTKVCASGRDGEPRDACRGDSGGPLMVLTDGSYQLVGVVLGGLGCGNPDFPGVYTKVSAYIDWIVGQLS